VSHLSAGQKGRFLLNNIAKPSADDNEDLSRELPNHSIFIQVGISGYIGIPRNIFRHIPIRLGASKRKQFPTIVATSLTTASQTLLLACAEALCQVYSSSSLCLSYLQT
jgi:hypothetical protein